MSDSSSTSKKAGTVRSCPNCRIRMSSHDVDNHVICTSCRGKNCNVTDRCDVCKSWSLEKMNAYVKHQSSLERKRLSKKRAREGKEVEVDPFLSVCTGVQGSDLGVAGDVVAIGDNDGSESSAATSATKQVMSGLVSELGSSLRSELDRNISARFQCMSDSLLEVLNRKFDSLEHSINPVTPNQFVSAPLPASVQPQSVEARPDPPHFKP